MAAALPAVDAAFFRAREAADAGSSSELSPTSQQAAASRSLQVGSTAFVTMTCRYRVLLGISSISFTIPQPYSRCCASSACMVDAAAEGMLRTADM